MMMEMMSFILRNELISLDSRLVLYYLYSLPNCARLTELYFLSKM
jgi:hypothetical protein